MSRIRELRWNTIAPPEEGDLDGFLLLAQAGILAKIGKALDLRAAVAAIAAAERPPSVPGSGREGDLR